MKRFIMCTFFTVLLFSSVSASELKTLQDQVRKFKEMDTTSIVPKPDNKDFYITSWDFNSNRPVKCPLHSTTNIDLVEKITSMYSQFTSQCREQSKVAYEDYINQFKEAAVDLNLTSASDSGQTTTDNIQATLQERQQMISGSAAMFDLFMNTEECAADMKRKSILEGIAGFFDYFSRAGLLVPNENGFYVATGSKILSGLLLSVNKLFQSTYNWENPEERKFFLNLNCSFYNLRREIRLRGVLDEQTPSLVSQQEIFKAHLSKIAKAIEEVRKGEEELVKLATSRKKQLVSSIVKREVPEGEAILNNYKELIASSKPHFAPIDEEMDNASSKLLIYSAMDTLRRNVDTLIAPFAERVKLLEELSSEFAGVPSFLASLPFSKITSSEWNKFVNDLIMVDTDPVRTFNNQIAIPLTIVFTKLEEGIEKISQKRQEKVDKVVVESAVGKYDVLIKDYKEAVKERLTLFTEFKTELEANIKSIDLLASPVMFTAQDDGSSNLTSIMETYDRIIKLILGRQGSEYLDYITDEGRERLKDFDKVYSKFEEEFSGRDDLSAKEKRFACQNAGFIKRRWRGAQGFADEAYDFVATNLDIFHGFGKKSLPKRLMKKNHARNVIDHSNSVVFAKDIISGKEVSTEDSGKYLYKKKSRRKQANQNSPFLNPYGTFKEDDMDDVDQVEFGGDTLEYKKLAGSLLLRINDNIERKQKIWTFSQTTQCNKVLSMD